MADGMELNSAAHASMYFVLCPRLGDYSTRPAGNYSDRQMLIERKPLEESSMLRKTTSAVLAAALLTCSISLAMAQGAGAGGGGDAGNAQGNTSAGRQDIPKNGDKDK
jgi:hypothetical protein